MQTEVKPRIVSEENETTENIMFPSKSPNRAEGEASWLNIHLGSPPLKKENRSFNFKAEINKETNISKNQFHRFEQPQSLDCDNMAPMIRITPMSDQESDSDSLMLHGKSSIPYINPAMDYLSPLTLQVPGSPHQIPVSS